MTCPPLLLTDTSEWLKVVIPIVVTLLMVVVGALIRKLSSLNDRLIKVETQFAFVWEIVEKKAAEILHHDNDAFDIDDWIDRYREAGGKLPDNELRDFMRALDSVTSNPKASDGARTMAALWLAVIGAKRVVSA